MGVKVNSSKKDWIYPLFILILGFFYYLSYLNYGISLGDEGFFVYGAERVLHGQLPMSDFTSYPPASYFLLALFFKVFGTDLLVSRFMEIAFLLADGLMIFYVSKRLMPANLAIIPSFILMLFPGPWETVFFTFGLLFPLVALARFLEKKTVIRALTVGWCTGISLLFKFESGLCSIVAAGIVLLGNRVWRDGSFVVDKKAILTFCKDISLCFLGFLSVILSVVTYYYFQSALAKLSYSLREFYEFVAVFGTNEPASRPRLLGVLTKFHIGNLKNLFFYLILLLYLYAIGKVVIHFFIVKRKNFPFFVPVLAMGLLSLIYFYLPFSQTHLLKSAAMAYILFGFVLYCSVEKKGVKSNVMFYILVIILGLYVLNSLNMRPYFNSGSISRVYGIRKEKATLTDLRKARIYLSKKDSDNMSSLVRYFEGKNGYLMPLFFEPMINFLTNLQNPTRFSIITGHYLRNRAKEKQLIGEVEKYRIQYLLIYRTLWFGEEIRLGNYAPILYEFVQKHYQLEKEIGGYLIFSRQ